MIKLVLQKDLILKYTTCLQFSKSVCGFHEETKEHWVFVLGSKFCNILAAFSSSHLLWDKRRTLCQKVFWTNELLLGYQKHNSFVALSTSGKHFIIVPLKLFCCSKFKDKFMRSLKLKKLILNVWGINFSNLCEIRRFLQCFPPKK